MVPVNGGPNMAVRAIEEVEQEADPVIPFTHPAAVRPQDVPSSEPPPPPSRPVKIVKQVDFPTAEVLAVLTLMLKVLSTRVILALAGAGAFILAFMAIQSNSMQGIAMAAVYAVTVFAPCIYLALRREA